MNLKNYNIIYDRAISSWDEALPLGNGKMGCLLYGDGPIRLSMDRVDLWDTRPHPATLEKAFNYENLIRLSLSGSKKDWAERARLFEDVYGEFPYPSKITAGRMELDFGGKAEKVSSKVDIEAAVGNLVFEKGQVEVFMHATRFVGVARVYGAYEMDIHMPEYISEMCYPKAEIVRDGAFTYYKQETMTEFSYGVVVYEVQRTADPDDAEVHFSVETDEVVRELYFTVVTSEDAADYIDYGKKQLTETATIGYKTLKGEHITWWADYWNKSRIHIGDELLERIYYQSWYLFASCSRKGCYPMPLQGVWTADNDQLPPWKGDYHHDTNTQLSYQSYLKANRMEEGEAFIDYLWNLKPQFEKVAKEFYGVKGLLIPGVSTIDGKPMGGWAQYSLSPTMSIWTAQSFDEYFLYTGDVEFLLERAFPFLAGVGEAIAGLLVERDGKLYLPLSSSPEIYDDKPEAYLTPNSNFDLALIHYLFQRLSSYCDILSRNMVDEDGIPQVKAQCEYILSRLDDIAVIDGYIGISPTERLPETHRHFSHLICLYPLHLINYDTDEHKELYHKAIEEIELLGMGLWVGFSYAMCAQVYAMAEMGNAAYEKLRQFADGFVGKNGFHLNGDFKNKGYSTFHYRPFTLESSFGYCDALQEMLLQEHQGYLHLFPAIPDAWKLRRISFENLRSYGGVLVSAVAEGGFLQELTLDVPKDMTLKVKNTFAGAKIDYIQLDLQAGKVTIYDA